MTTETEPPIKIDDLTEVISIRLSKNQKQFIEANNIAISAWFRQVINREINKKEKEENTCQGCGYTDKECVCSENIEER